MEKERSGKGKVRFKAAAACLLLMWCYESSDFFFSVDSSLNQTRQPEETLWLSEYFFCKNTSRKKRHLHKKKNIFVIMCFVNKKTWQPNSSWTFAPIYQNISYIYRKTFNYWTCQSVHHHTYRKVSFYVSNHMVQNRLDTFPSDEIVITISKRTKNHNFKIWQRIWYISNSIFLIQNHDTIKL